MSLVAFFADIPMYLPLAHDGGLPVGTVWMLWAQNKSPIRSVLPLSLLSRDRDFFRL